MSRTTTMESEPYREDDTSGTYKVISVRGVGKALEKTENALPLLDAPKNNGKGAGVLEDQHEDVNASDYEESAAD